MSQPDIFNLSLCKSSINTCCSDVGVAVSQKSRKKSKKKRKRERERERKRERESEREIKREREREREREMASVDICLRSCLADVCSSRVEQLPG